MVQHHVPRSDFHVLIVVPTLDEEMYIGRVLEQLLASARTCSARIVVADGGSADSTRTIVQQFVADQDCVILMDNPERRQSAAINLAVEQYGGGCDWLIRIDAHSGYPSDYCEILLAEAKTTSADSVVVSMLAVGHEFWQKTIAAAQNSLFGNGGAAHRTAPMGRFVEHGHHALMRLAAFRAVGGYDKNFSHNEDVDLDIRLAKAGFRIWLTARTQIVYFPRRTVAGVTRQYFAFGRGRAKTALKHRMGLRLRHAVLLSIAPGLGLVALAPLHAAFLSPTAVWVAGCAAAGVAIARSAGLLRGLAAGLVAGVMQLAWSAGFWYELGADRIRAINAYVDLRNKIN